MEYYDIEQDVAAYPEAWCYVVFSRRGPGKTYSALKGSYLNERTIAYTRRIKGDIQMITHEFNGKSMSPYEPIMRDNPDIRVKSEFWNDEGMAVFYHVNEAGEAVGKPITYVLAISNISKYRSFDLSECEWFVVDEFMPLVGQKRIKGEGGGVLDLYMTINRDREARGLDPLKLILFSNTDKISGPLMDTLEIVDDLAEMIYHGDSIRYLEKRGILLHHLTEDKYQFTDENRTAIEKGMAGTAWARAALGGEFAFTDFSNVRKIKPKNYKPIWCFIWHRKQYMVLLNYESAKYHIKEGKVKGVPLYDLSKENDQKRFFLEVVIDIRNECIDNRVTFESYSLYDLIMNYKNFFEV